MYTFKISTGELLNNDGSLLTKAYAGGNCGKNPEGVNNPDMVNVPCIGPLPPGIYTFGEPVYNSHLGPTAIPLIPDKDNEMYDRSGFYIHWDTKVSGNASEGCICPYGANGVVIQQMIDSGNTELQVIV